MRAHQFAHVERGEPVEQSVPDDRDQRGRDQQLGKAGQRIVRQLKARGIGILITDHNVRETLGICDRAYIINDGSVLAYGIPEEIVYNESVRKVYLGEHFRL